LYVNPRKHAGVHFYVDVKLIVSALRREHILQEVEKEKATQGRSRDLEPNNLTGSII
jgi:heme exporter protein D